jgi:hypothetical protein
MVVVTPAGAFLTLQHTDGFMIGNDSLNGLLNDADGG